MKRLHFVEPNFKCEVEDRGGNRYDMYFHAASEDELRKRLEAKRLKLLSVSSYDFKTWRERAAKAAEDAETKRIQPGFEFNNQVWSEIKQYLFELAGGKCGYCEAEVQVVSYGDVEHYRPKKKVEEDKLHPGYYWLAYDITNYVPCCRKCNDARAKANHFPLADGCPRAKSLKEIDQEKPLLLNPFHVEDPSQHLRFLGPEADERFGEIEGVTPEGETSCRLYNLNRLYLVEDRCQRFKTLEERLRLAECQIAEWKSKADETSATFLRSLLEERHPYSLMVRTVVARWLTRKIKKEQEEEAKRRARHQALVSALENDLKMLGN